MRAELIALDKSKPGTLSSAHEGPRTFSGMMSQAFNLATGVTALQVPYNGATPMIQDTVGGRTQIVFLSSAAVAPFIKRGDLRPIAVTVGKRVTGLENVPALAETYPGFDYSGWFAVLAPAGTPAAIINRIHDEALKALQEKVRTDGKLKPWLAKHGLDGLQGLWSRIHIEQGWENALEAALRERMGLPKDHNLIARPIAKLETVLVAAPDYLRQHGTPKQPSDLLTHNCLQMNDAPWTLIHHDGNSETLDVRGPFIANNRGMLHQLALSGQGIAQAAASWVQPDLQANRLVHIMKKWAPPTVQAYAVTTTRLLPAKVRVFLDFLVEHLEHYPVAPEKMQD